MLVVTVNGTVVYEGRDESAACAAWSEHAPLLTDDDAMVWTVDGRVHLAAQRVSA